jgi:hypothetical protein
MDGMSDEPVLYATPEEAEAGEKAKAEKAETERKTKLVDLARKRFSSAEEAESEIRRQADLDIRFRAGEQWDASVLAERKLDNRPALVINRMPQFERNITNEQRQSKPAMQVSAVDSGADRDTAEVIQGLIRHIEYDSNADVAYDTALTSAVRGGFGYIRLVSEFEAEDSFEQVLKIKRVRDPFSIYLDPGHQEQDASDAEWGFVVDDGMSKEQFEAEYPKCNAAAAGWGNRVNTGGHTCQVVEYFYREREKDELLVLQKVHPLLRPDTGEPVLDPQTGRPAAVPVGEPFVMFASDVEADEALKSSVSVLAHRDTQRIRVKWAKIAGSEVVEESEFPSKYIPLIPVLGDELWVGGKRILEGVVRHAKDSQRMYNFWSTAITETIALAPKAPWIVAEGQLKGREKQWQRAAKRNVPYLEYAIVPNAAPPSRNAFEAPIAGMTQAMMFAADDMKATTGIYDAALGNRSNETAGIAIEQRRQQSQTSTSHFPDNLARAMRHLGRILIDAIPRVYDSARIVRVLGEDNSEKMVSINGAPTPEGQERTFALDTGRYDVTVSMGPSYASKRSQAAAGMLEFMRVDPPAAPLLGDLLVESMDWPGAKTAAERLRKMLPPEIRPPDDKKLPSAQQLQQQLQQLMQQQEQLVAKLHEAEDVVQEKERQLLAKADDNASKERIALLNAHVTLLTTAAQLDSKERTEDIQLLKDEAAQMSKRLGATGATPLNGDTTHG